MPTGEIRVSTRAGSFARLRPPSDTYRFDRVLLLVLLLATLSAPGLVSGKSPLWYLLPGAVIAAAILIRARTPSTLIRRPVASDVVLLMLMVLGLAGSMYGIVFLGTTATARPVFVPMVIAFLYLLMLEGHTDDEADALVRGLIWIGIVYIALNAAVIFGLVPGPGLAGDHPFRNSQLPFVTMAVVGAFELRRWRLVGLLAVLVAFMVVSYPSATTILVAVGTLATLYVAQPRASGVRASLVAILGSVVVVAGLLNSTSSVEVTSRYFATVGKADTVPTRLLLWEEGIRRFEDSPVIGNAFSGDTNAVIVRDVGPPLQLPFHNDFILFLATGGVVGLGLLLAWAAATEAIVLRRYWAFAAAGGHAHARLLRTLLVGFNAFFVAAAFNPQFTSVSASTTIFAVYGLMLSTGSPVRQDA